MKYLNALPWVFALSFCWGTNLVANRFSLGQFEPFNFIFLRLSIAIMVVLLVLLATGKRFPSGRKLWRNSIISGILGVSIPIPAFVISLRYISSGVSGVYTTLAPVLLVVAAHFFLPDEKMTINKAAGVSFALGGALVLAIRGESGLADGGEQAGLGVAIIFVGMVASCANTLFVRRNMQGTNVMQVTMVRLLTGLVIMLLCTVLFGDFSLAKVEQSGWFVLVYAALVGSLAAQFLAFYIQRTYGATAYSLTSFMIPVVATVAGAIVLDEIITAGMLAGMSLIAIGLLLLNRPTQTK